MNQNPKIFSKELFLPKKYHETPKFAMSSLGFNNNKMVQSSLARQETKKKEFRQLMGTEIYGDAADSLRIEEDEME